MKFEIQIRSILQHAWAEIEHDLQYKSAEAVPKEVRRRFARLAGLLELGDVEFMGIRDQIRTYQRDLPNAIRATPNQVFVDQDSLRTLIRESPLIADLDEKIAAVVPTRLEDTLALGMAVAQLNQVGLRTIEAVESSLAANSDKVLRFATALLHRDDFPGSPGSVSVVNRGISVGYLGYVLLLQTKTAPQIAQIFDAAGIQSGASNEVLAEALCEVYANM